MISKFNPQFDPKNRTETRTAVNNLKTLLKQELKKPENKDRFVAEGERVTLTGPVSVKLEDGASLSFNSGYTRNYGPEGKVYDGTSFDDDPMTDDAMNVTYWPPELGELYHEYQIAETAEKAPWWKPLSPDRGELSVVKFAHEPFPCGIGGSGGTYHLGTGEHGFIIT